MFGSPPLHASRLVPSAALILAAAWVGHDPAVLALGALALACAALPARSTTDVLIGHDRSLQRHLARCRRRGEGAQLVVAHGRGARVLATHLRIADAVRLTAGERADELVLLVDDDVDRAALEARLGRHVPGLAFGWAGFPQDGVLLDELIAAARHHALDVEAERAPLSLLISKAGTP